MTTSARTAWLRSVPGGAQPRHQLVCLPHAGGGASGFRPWRARLPDDVEILAAQYPGREDRMDEDPATDLTELADGVAAALAGVLDGPYTLFGHSMGAYVGYQLVQVLERYGMPPPRRLIVSSQFAPGRLPDRAVRDLDDDAVLAVVEWLSGGTAAIRDDAELRAFVAGVVRADYRAVETYRPDPVPITVPVSAFCGADDPAVRPDQVAEWADLCRAGFRHTVFPGGHFYLRDHPDDTVSAVTAAITGTEQES